MHNGSIGIIIVLDKIQQNLSWVTEKFGLSFQKGGHWSQVIASVPDQQPLIQIIQHLYKLMYLMY